MFVTPKFAQELFGNLYNLFLPDELKITKSDIRSARIKSPFDACATCGKHQTQLQLKKCGRCKAVFYCSVACQKNDWKQHKTECKKLSQKIKE